MTGPPNKRQKREEYHKNHAAAIAAAAAGTGNVSASDAYTATTTGEHGGDVGGKLHQKKQKQKQSKNQVVVELPKKKFYRQRAHANPFSDHAVFYPETPEKMDWSSHYPYFAVEPKELSSEEASPSEETKPRQIRKQVEIADIGCGFGGLLVALSPVFPDTLMLGMEIRFQVLSYVTSRISALRVQNLPPPSSTTSTPPPYANISGLRTNSMKFLPQYFRPASLSKIFLCFPDPHFKQRKHKARIVSRSLCAEYAYVLRKGEGMVYTITDVEELHDWMAKCFDGPKKHRVKSESNEEEEVVVEEEDDGEDMGAISGVEELFERVPEEELANDPCVKIMSEETEEGKKVTRNGGRKFIGVWRRKEDPEWP